MTPSAMTPVEEHAALTEALTAEREGLRSVLPVLINQREGRTLLAVLDVLIEELPEVPTRTGTNCALRCPECAQTWNKNPVVRAARAAVGAS